MSYASEFCSPYPGRSGASNAAVARCSSLTLLTYAHAADAHGPLLWTNYVISGIWRVENLSAKGAFWGEKVRRGHLVVLMVGPEAVLSTLEARMHLIFASWCSIIRSLRAHAAGPLRCPGDERPGRGNCPVCRQVELCARAAESSNRLLLSVEPIQPLQPGPRGSPQMLQKPHSEAPARSIPRTRPMKRARALERNTASLLLKTRRKRAFLLKRLVKHARQCEIPRRISTVAQTGLHERCRDAYDFYPIPPRVLYLVTPLATSPWRRARIHTVQSIHRLDPTALLICGPLIHYTVPSRGPIQSEKKKRNEQAPLTGTLDGYSTAGDKCLRHPPRRYLVHKPPYRLPM